METIRIDRIRAYLLNGYALNRYVLVGYVLNGYVLVGYVLVGYVLNGYVWDMCGVRYANNLLKNPATKRLSGKKGVFLLEARPIFASSIISLWRNPHFEKNVSRKLYQNETTC